MERPSLRLCLSEPPNVAAAPLLPRFPATFWADRVSVAVSKESVPAACAV